MFVKFELGIFILSISNKKWSVQHTQGKFAAANIFIPLKDTRDSKHDRVKIRVGC